MDRFLRQQDIIPADIHDKKISIIGCGAIGRQVAIMAAAMGPKNLELIDFDTVEDHNRTTQGYRISDLGQPKLQVLKSYIEELYDDVPVDAREEKFPDNYRRLGDIIIFCTDNIVARTNAWEVLKNKSFEFLIDGRMLAENMRVICGTAEEMRSFYDDTLYPPEEDLAGSCTERMTLYSASVCAGNMLAKLNRFLRNQEYNNDIMMSLVNEEYSSSEGGFASE